MAGSPRCAGAAPRRAQGRIRSPAAGRSRPAPRYSSPCPWRARRSSRYLLRLAADEAALARDVGKQVPQLATATVQTGHHGADGSVHDLGDFLVGETLDVGKVHREPELLWQLLQRRLHVAVGQPVQRLDLGRAQAAGRVTLRLRDLPVADLLGRLL